MIRFDTPLYLLFIVLPLALPFVAGTIILISFWKDDLNRLIGFFTLKPVLAYPLWFYITTTVVNTWYDNWLDNIMQSFDKLLPLGPAIILSIVIIYIFRNMFTHRLAQLFLGLDILRMLNTLILAGSEDSYVDFFSVRFGLLLPSIIAVLALIIAFNRKASTNSDMYKA